MKINYKKHIPFVLTCAGAFGVISTTVLAVKATPKALDIIECENANSDHILTKKEVIKIAWKPYIPAIVSGSITILCIFGSNYFSARTNASLIAAYNMLNTKFVEYRDKLREASNLSEKDFEAEILRSKMDENMVINNEKELFFDFNSMQYFQSTMEDLKIAENLLNHQIYTEGYANMNDLYDILHIKHVPYGYQMGWTINSHDDLYGCAGLEFQFEPVMFDDGLECKILTISYPPSWEYFC